MDSKRRVTFVWLCLFGVLSFHTCAFGHYLWVTVDRERSNINIYFEESPKAGDGHYLDPFVKSGKSWIRTIESPQPKKLKMVEKDVKNERWLASSVAKTPPRGIESYGKFGVYQYGTTNVLLHYYARHLEVSTHEELHELARAEHMALDIVPHDDAGAMELKILWQGKPASGRLVHIRGPQKMKANIKSNENGVVRFEIQKKGTYTFRTSVEEDVSGRDGDQDYSLIRHNATMIMTLPLQR